MRMACRRNETATTRLPNNSLTKAFMQLRYLKANKLTDRNAWKTKEIPKKSRDLFTLLGLPLPPRGCSGTRCIPGSWGFRLIVCIRFICAATFLTVSGGRREIRTLGSY